MCDRVASSADSQGSQAREEKAASSQRVHGKCRQSVGTQSERGEVRHPGSHSQARPHGQVSQGLGGPLSLEGSRCRRPGRKHQRHRCREGESEEMTEWPSQEARNPGWRHWGPDPQQSRQRCP